MKVKYLRREYLNRRVTHEQYYGQFVTNEVIDAVSRQIGVARILESNDPSFNDINLRMWDGIFPAIRALTHKKVFAANGGCYMSLSDSVCIAKEAARQIVLQHKQSEDSK